MTFDRVSKLISLKNYILTFLEYWKRLSMQGSNKGNLVKEGDIQQESNNRDLSVGIVVLNYNCAIDTIAVVALMQNYPFVSEVQIVDNCSTDNSILEIRKAICSGALGGKVQFAVAASNQGYAAGNNYGVGKNKKPFQKSENPIIPINTTKKLAKTAGVGTGAVARMMQL